MGIFTRIKDIAAADMHRLLDQVEDPISMAKHYIRQLEDQIDQARSALETQMAAEQRYDLLLASTAAIINKRERQAKFAVERNQDDIAAIAIQEKLHHAKLHQTYTEQRETVRKQAETLRSELNRLQKVHTELSDKLTFLLVRANAVNTIRETAKTAPSSDISKISRGFERMEQKLMSVEAGTLANPSEDKLTDWSQQQEVQEELAKLKAPKQSC
ncbi:PspA/IM30 family protein [Paenibacillus sp. XY044]|uniref:PspA/IM30 family protein n=1 Tax=Paenibacillus sp. XY044 TaxID=2026089 RepID=UPI0015C691A3|nr:PspA/IM30 family protein [Paenibacillus sp. XY044]